MSDIYTWDELENSGDLEGYQPCYVQIDAQVCREIPCETCGGSNVYHGMRNDRGSYRAFAECKDCGNVVEF